MEHLLDTSVLSTCDSVLSAFDESIMFNMRSSPTGESSVYHAHEADALNTVVGLSLWCILQWKCTISYYMMDGCVRCVYVLYWLCCNSFTWWDVIAVVARMCVSAVVVITMSYMFLPNYHIPLGT